MPFNIVSLIVPLAYNILSKLAPLYKTLPRERLPVDLPETKTLLSDPISKTCINCLFCPTFHDWVIPIGCIVAASLPVLPAEVASANDFTPMIVSAANVFAAASIPKSVRTAGPAAIKT